MHSHIFPAASLLLGLTRAVPFHYSTDSFLFTRQEADFDEYDFSAIKKMAALGDSFSAGIGAGNRLGKALDIDNVANHYSDWWCSRYDNSYPYLLNKGLGDLNTQGGKFQFLSCSGAQTQEVIETQVDKMDADQDVILISSGGNDVGFADVINQCVYQFFSPTKTLITLTGLAAMRAGLREWLAEQTERVGIELPDELPEIDLAKYARTCEEQLAESKKMIEDPAFSQGISDLVDKAKAKLSPDGRIYYTSYSRYWSPDATNDDWCADPEHTWSVFLSKLPNLADWQDPIALTSDHRLKMNEFVDLVNDKISQVVSKSSDKVEFVEWGEFASGVGGQFCRNDVEEPALTRWNAAFYEFNINDAMGTSPFRRSNTEVVPGSFEGIMNGLAGAAYELGVTYKDDANAGDGGIQKRANFIPDGFGRIFHPTAFMHRTIKDLVGWRMASHNAVARNIDLGPQIVLPGDTCDLPSGPAAGICTDKDASGLLSSDFSAVYDDFCADFNDPLVDKAVPFSWEMEVDGLEDAQATGKTKVRMSWIKNKNSNDCTLDCTEALRSLTETCGKAGSHDVQSMTTITVAGVQMAKAAEVDVECGTYSYSVELPPTEPTITPDLPDQGIKCASTDPNNMKWMDRDKMNDRIGEFCTDAAAQRVHDKDSGSTARDYDSGSNDSWVGISIDFPYDFVPTEDECIRHLTNLMDSCDGNNPANPMNWKYGGFNVVGNAIYRIVPKMADRYVPGMCSMHIHHVSSWTGRDGPGTHKTWTFYLSIKKVVDGEGNFVTHTTGGHQEAGDGNPLVLPGLYADLVFTPEARKDQYIQFTIGDQHWTTADQAKDQMPRCNVGGWDPRGGSPQGRDMDCFFRC